MKVGEDMVNKMIKEVEKVWAPEIVSHEGNQGSFLNVIYDC